MATSATAAPAAANAGAQSRCAIRLAAVAIPITRNAAVPASAANTAQYRIWEATTPGPIAACRTRRANSTVSSRRTRLTPKSTAPVRRGGPVESQSILAECQHAATDDHGRGEHRDAERAQDHRGDADHQDGFRGRDEERVADEHDDGERRWEPHRQPATLRCRDRVNPARVASSGSRGSHSRIVSPRRCRAAGQTPPFWKRAPNGGLSEMTGPGAGNPPRGRSATSAPT